MVKTVHTIRNQMRKLVEEVSMKEYRYSDDNKEAVKTELFDAFNVNSDEILGGLSENEVADTGEILFHDKMNGPFTFTFECITWKGDTDYYEKCEIESYTATADNFVDACKEAFDWREKHLYDIYDSVVFDDVK